MRHRLGVDIGGTFTDFALVDDSSGSVSIHKQLTTPQDPSLAVLDGIDRLLQRERVPISGLANVIHGSTLVTNAVIERRGARTGMLVTRGFRDVLDIAMERRYDLYDMRIRYPEPMVPRELRIEVAERIRPDGDVAQALDTAAVAEAAAELIERQRVEAIAVCFLHSFTNPRHERQVCDLLRDRYPGVYVSLSSDVFPYMREYERWTTTAMNAFAQPMVDRYLANLERGLAQRGFDGSFYVMASSGGTVTTETARQYPVRMLESGPAAGVLMSARHGRALGIRNLLSYDMGGTTAKGSIVREGKPSRVYELEVARVHEFKFGSGLPAKVPVIDMIEIGAGGGSVAEVDERGVIRVGPRSAGADPGPACYGRGGDQPTLTDADLILGYLSPSFFLGGDMDLDTAAAARAIERRIGAALGVDAPRAAWGIHEVINEDVARAFRVHASEIGFDYRSASMVAFGGSGPMHALRIARKLQIPRVVLPVGTGVMSAFGMLVSPLSFQVARSRRIVHDDLAPEDFAALFDELEREASDVLLRAGVDPSQLRVSRQLDMRYHGQGHEIEVALPDSEDVAGLLARLPQLYGDAYAKVFSLSYIDAPIELVNWKVEVAAPEPAVAATFHLTRTGAATTALKGHRKAYFDEVGGFADTPVYDRYALAPDDEIVGPALIEERESTCVVGVGDRLSVDEHGNLVAQVQLAGSEHER